MLTPLYYNSQIKKAREQRALKAELFMGKRGIKDTLTLPFFDDFSALGVIANDTLWTDQAVFINADFPVDPPSIGVATFDGLNEYGLAYEDLNSSLFGPADTLSSQPVDLSSLDAGDSIYLSFFYQAQGRSFEVLKTSDSLVLQFRNRLGAWVNVWSHAGMGRQPFRLAMVEVKDTSYFHESFRFRWINYQTYVGNLKQWHLDYIYLNQGRSAVDTVFEDQAMVELPPFPFEPYTHMPWKQVQVNFAKYLRPDYKIPVSNMALTGETFTIAVRVDDPDGEVGEQTLTGQSLPPDSITTFTLDPDPVLFSTAADSSTIRVVSTLSGILGGNDQKRNDSAVRIVELANYYAYDDGTAETGYGLRNGNGSVAYAFELETGDSLRAMAIHFTQAEATVASGFALKVWQHIAPVGEPSGPKDVVLYSKEVGLPLYTDSINGFHIYMLDSAVFVTGRFFIGWTQSSTFLLNVGFDRNYRLAGQEVPNPNLYYNVQGKWQNATVPGTLMMRPVLGPMWPTPLGVNEEMSRTYPDMEVYPNPVTGGVVHFECAQPIEQVFLFGMDGKLLRSERGDIHQMNTENLPDGVYLLRLQTLNDAWISKKIIVRH